MSYAYSVDVSLYFFSDGLILPPRYLPQVPDPSLCVLPFLRYLQLWYLAPRLKALHAP